MTGRPLAAAVVAAADEAWGACRPVWERLAAIALANQARVLQAFQAAGVSESDFTASAGYGYGDPARERLEQVYSQVFAAEAALVRPQIVSGTHAIALALFACLGPGDELVSATGAPYDSLQPVIGHRGPVAGSLAEWGVVYKEAAPRPGAALPTAAQVQELLGPKVRAVFIQRSRGYQQRPALSVAAIAHLVAAVRAVQPAAAIIVDNCYGEFVETSEPLAAGADLIAGSLIKNPGGGLAPTGGYVAGRRDLVDRAAARLSAPGLGGAVGPSLHLGRCLLQGFFLAPHVTAQALQGAVFTARLFAALGVAVDPAYDAPRADLVQTVTLGNAAAQADRKSVV